MKPHNETSKHGIGLYTYEQAKNTTPFQYFAQIIVGTIVALSGMVLGYAKYQSSTPHTAGFIASAALIVIGIFMAHAGVIFWCRRLRKPSN